jgi:hypothetical protein
MQDRNDVTEMRQTMLQLFEGSASTRLPGAVTFNCLTLVDITGKEHKIPLEFCTSYRVSLSSDFGKPSHHILQQLDDMLKVVFKGESDEARIQRQYMDQGQYDLCIDEGTRVTQLTSRRYGVQKIDVGMKIVMRAIFEIPLRWNNSYRCDSCGQSNYSLHPNDIESPGSEWTICW